MRLTKNFLSNEFACKCGCGEESISEVIIMLCQLVRSHFDKPVTITSGVRCEEHNAKVGGAVDSQHRLRDGKGHAADIKVAGVDPEDVYEYLDTMFPKSLGLGLYSSWVHIDDRVGQAYRWDNR